MADLTITAANVLPVAGSAVESGLAGEAVTAGKTVYLDSATNRYLLADSNSATVAARTPKGIALNGAATGQPLTVLLSGPITIGATMTAGTIYTLSETPGGIQPATDLGSGEYVSVIGVATSTTVLNVKIQSSGVAI